MRNKKNDDEDFGYFNDFISASGGTPDWDKPEPEDENKEDDFIGDEEPCWMFSTIASIIMNSNKPFGMNFESDKIEEFLKARGYKIIEKYNEDLGDSIRVAIKSDQSHISGDVSDNIRTVFSREVQDILLGWLLKIGGKK